METQQTIHSIDVARWMHHPFGFPQRHYSGVSQKPRARKFVIRRFLQQGNSRCAARLARRCQQRSIVGYSHTSVQHCAQLLRRLPNQGSARQSLASTKRLFRCPHLQNQARTCQRKVSKGQGPSCQLDWKGWRRVSVNLPSIGSSYP